MTTPNLARRAELGSLKRARTRDAIIVAAIDLIRQRTDAQPPTIDEFIVAAGVARGTFYNHFDTKEDLLQAASAHVADAIDDLITPRIEGVEDPAQRICIATQEFIRLCRERPEWGWVLVQTAPRVAWSEGMREGVLTDIRAGVKRGTFVVPSIQAASALGMGTLAMAIRTAMTERTPKDFGQSIAIMTLRAMGVSTQESQRIAHLPIPAPRG